MVTKTFRSTAEATDYLLKARYTWNDKFQRWERLVNGINKRAFVGACKTGEITICSA